MERWSDDEGASGLAGLSEAAVVTVKAAAGGQGGVVLMLVRRDEVTVDWLSFFL